MTPMQIATNNVINARQEGQVTALIALYDADIIDNIGNRVEAIRGILIDTLQFDPSDADYWLKHLGVV